MAGTEIAVIGGGIVGGSIAWQLASREAGNVTVYEKSVIAAGASGRTGALLRRHYTNEPEARLAQLGWETYRDWEHCGRRHMWLCAMACGRHRRDQEATSPAMST